MNKVVRLPRSLKLQLRRSEVRSLKSSYPCYKSETQGAQSWTWSQPVSVERVDVVLARAAGSCSGGKGCDGLAGGRAGVYFRSFCVCDKLASKGSLACL